jgi:hypothetical protein
MRGASPRKERTLDYNIYSDEVRQTYFYFLQEKLKTPPSQVAAFTYLVLMGFMY